MAVTASTPANIVIGAGDVYVDGSVVGATQDDNVFRIDREYAVPDLNGTKGALVNTDFIVKSEALMETTIPEISESIMAVMWPGSTSTDGDGGSVIIDETGSSRIPASDYHDWELRIPGLTMNFSFQLDNAINLGKIEMSAANKANMKPRLELHSRWDPDDLTVSPHRIVISPLVSS